ncbi:MAG: hypothetical protein VCA37_12565, partial [Roseibacillus sp.]
KKAEREARKKAEREARKKAEREARKKAEREAKKKAEREAKKKAEREAKEKAKREAREKAEQNKIKVKSVAKKLVGERIRKKTASNPATSEKTSGKQKLPTPPKGVNASAQSPSPAGQANDKPVAPPKANAANGNSLWNLFGLLKRKQVIVESPQRSTNGRTDAPKEKPNRSEPQVESAKPAAKPPTKNGAGSHAAQPMDSSSGAKSKPAKATAESMTGPSGNGSSAKLEASDGEKGKKNAPQKTTSPGGPPRSTILPPVKTKKEIPIGRGQEPKKPAPAASKDSPRELATSNRAIRLTNPVSGTNRTILPRPRDKRIEEERQVSARRRPIRLEEGESSLPAPRVKQPSAMANKVSDLLADPNLEDDPFDALLDDDFDVVKLFPEIEPISSGMSKE